MILLYEETIKRLKKAEILAYNSDYVNFEKEIKRTQEIIAYLNSTLDRKHHISAKLSRMYNFFYYQMARIIAGRNVELIKELIPLIEELKDVYKQADILSKRQGV